jgi:glyoxylase-like metal-dependent hydrolase (beta-lactamase superfamily II)
MRTNFTVSDMTVHRIVEQEAGFTPILEFLPSLSQELLDENRSWMVPGALDPAGMAVLCFQSYVVKTPHHTILVDACIGNDKSFPHRPTWHRKSDSNWMQALKAAGVTVDNIDFVMCTHLHGDHVGWNTRMENGRWVPTFPNAKYLFSKKEYEYWDGVHRETPLDPMTDSVLPIIDANKAELVTSDHALNDHIRLTPTPGHTPDHFAVCAGRGGDRAVFTGDPDPFADPGALSGPRDAGRLRPAAGLGHPPRLFRTLLRYQHLVLHDALPLAVRRPHQALG